MLVGLTALFLQASSAGHMLLVEHSRCIEHGRLVHGHETHARRDIAQDTAGKTALRSAPESDAGDDHCELTAERRAAPTRVVEARVSDAALSADQLSLLAQMSRVDDGPRFRVAPKNSPPPA